MECWPLGACHLRSKPPAMSRRRSSAASTDGVYLAMFAVSLRVASKASKLRAASGSACDGQNQSPGQNAPRRDRRRGITRHDPRPIGGAPMAPENPLLGVPGLRHLDRPPRAALSSGARSPLVLVRGAG